MSEAVAAEAVAVKVRVVISEVRAGTGKARRRDKERGMSKSILQDRKQ